MITPPTNPLQDIRQLLDLFKKWPGAILILVFSALLYRTFSLESQTNELKNTVEQLTTNVQEYQEMVESKDALLEEQKEIRRNHDDQVNRLIHGLQNSRNVASALRQLIAQRDEALATVERNIERKDEEIMMQAQQISDLIDQNDHLKSQNKILDARVRELEIQEAEFVRIKNDNEVLTRQYKRVKQELDSIKRNAIPKLLFAEIITYSNGYKDPGKEIKRTLKAKDIRYIRILFRLDRPLEENEVVEVALSNNDFNRQSPLVHDNITDDGEYYVDFMVRKRDIQSGFLYTRYLLQGKVIGSRNVFLE
jgi:hypothetical protein